MENSESPLVYDNPKIETYNRAIEKNRSNNNIWDTVFCNNIHNDLVKDPYIPELSLDFFRDKIKGHTLVDPGCGLVYAHIVDVAEKLGASKYIGIDLRGEPATPETKDIQPFPVWKIKGDMLESIAKLETGSANFTFNGIDGELLGTREASREYIDYLTDEVARVTRPKGIVFGIDMFPIANQLSEKGFRLISPNDFGLISSYRILEKI